MSSCKLVICICVLPEFISLQVACFKRFLKESVDFCYVDDSKNEQLSLRIKEECEKGGHEYYRSPPHGSGREDVSCRHADTLLHGLQNMRKVNALGVPYTYIGTFDSDLFPVTQMSLENLLKEKDLLCLKMKTFHMTYFWPGCCIWRTDIHSLENYTWDICVDSGIRCDTGGTTHFYNKYHRSNPIELVEYKFKDIDRVKWLSLLMRLPRAIMNFCIEDIPLADACGVRWWSDIYTDPQHSFYLFHLRDVSNWQGLNGSYLESKFKGFYKACYDLLSNDSNLPPTFDEQQKMFAAIMGQSIDHICEP